MLGDPRSGSKVREALDRDIAKSGKDRCQIVAYRDSQPSAAFHCREDRRDLRSGLWASHVYPILATQSNRTHRVLRKVIAQFKFGIFQESCKFRPKCERVLAGLAERTGGQCKGLRCFDLATDIIQKMPGSFLTQSMTPGETNSSAASFGVDGK